MKNSIEICLIGIFLLTGCLEKVKEKEVVAEPQTQNLEKNKDWLYLFDGTTTEGWRGYNSTELPASWIIEDGALKSLGKGGDIGGDIVYSSQEFENFELYLEWKISEGGNSGVFYHVQEGEQYESPYQNAPEYQLIDQLGFPQKLEDWQSVGADYGMYITDKANLVVKQAGEWNTTRIVFQPNKVRHWLNGKKVIEFIPWSDDWNMKKEKGKWKDYPDYGLAKKGFIGLQDHGSFIWFKNIRIKEL
ncbi:3-keto-disaccharide hydrolase [Flagellimonas eckloniae]|uniref:Glycosyl hydrolase n=1 Tax=Flagellimonas eckloniae TaxID=346185 RepID=A0A0Q0XK87_9FLAO|nr:DUF1080 domain-containing protein [Allomuricauda eckloniae]KQC31302.1 glycosyl hydrolase [Allomuricauda eckloniae]